MTASGLIPRITPFITPTNGSLPPKSVGSVMPRPASPPIQPPPLHQEAGCLGHDISVLLLGPGLHVERLGTLPHNPAVENQPFSDGGGPSELDLQLGTHCDDLT